MLKEGAHVTIAARDLAACQAAKEELEPEGQACGGTVRLARLDLEDPASIRTFAQEQAKDAQPIKLLVNNAGAQREQWAQAQQRAWAASSPAGASAPSSVHAAHAHCAHAQRVRGGAGVMGVGYAERTPAGAAAPGVMDRHILCNHLGPFLLTQLLSDRLAEGSRVVNIASRAHRAGALAFDGGTGALLQRPGVFW